MNGLPSLERIRNRLIVYLVGIIFGLTVLFFSAWYLLEMSIDDAYLQNGAAIWVIQYMRKNDGRWPPDWDSLVQMHKESGGQGDFDALKDRVFTDFSVDAKVLEKQSIESDKVPFDVIHARWPLSSFMDDGPNAYIYHYFRHKAGIADPTRPVDNSGSVTVPTPRPLQ